MKHFTAFLKSLARRYNRTSLILRIVIGLVIGVILALIVPGWSWIGEFGNLFVGALKGIAPVLVFVLVASALAQKSSRLDSRFGTVIGLYMLTTFLAAVLAVFTSQMFPLKSLWRRWKKPPSLRRDWVMSSTPCWPIS